VVQLYTQDKVASSLRPVKELKGFEKISLEPNEKRTVTFRLKPESLGFYNDDMDFVVEAGEFNVWVGTSSDKGLKGGFYLTE